MSFGDRLRQTVNGAASFGDIHRQTVNGAVLCNDLPRLMVGWAVLSGDSMLMVTGDERSWLTAAVVSWSALMSTPSSLSCSPSSSSSPTPVTTKPTITQPTAPVTCRCNPWRETTLRPPWWNTLEITLMKDYWNDHPYEIPLRDHPDKRPLRDQSWWKTKRPPWWKTTDRPPWWKTRHITLMKDHWETTLMKDHWETTLMKDHWQITLMKDHCKTTLMKDHREDHPDERPMTNHTDKRPPWWQTPLFQDHFLWLPHPTPPTKKRPTDPWPRIVHFSKTISARFSGGPVVLEERFEHTDQRPECQKAFFTDIKLAALPFRRSTHQHELTTFPHTGSKMKGKSLWWVHFTSFPSCFRLALGNT